MASLEAAPFDANGLGLGRVNTRRDGEWRTITRWPLGGTGRCAWPACPICPVSVARSRSGWWRPNLKTPVTVLVHARILATVACLGRTCRRNVARTLHVFDRPVEPAEIIAAFLMEGDEQWVSVTAR